MRAKQPSRAPDDRSPLPAAAPAGKYFVRHLEWLKARPSVIIDDDPTWPDEDVVNGESVDGSRGAD